MVTIIINIHRIIIKTSNKIHKKKSKINISENMKYTCVQYYNHCVFCCACLYRHTIITEDYYYYHCVCGVVNIDMNKQTSKTKKKLSKK